MLEKPIEYKEIESQQNGAPIYAENINQIISNIELIKGGERNEAPVGNIKDIYEIKEALNNSITENKDSINELKTNTDNLTENLNNLETNYNELNTELETVKEKQAEIEREMETTLKNSVLEEFNKKFTELQTNIINIKTTILETIFTVGSVYGTTDDNFDPNTVFGFGAWEKVEEGRFLQAGNGTNGGEKAEAGLPAAVGEFEVLMHGQAKQSGMATRTGKNRMQLGVTSGNNVVISDTIQIHLTNGNRIFGASDTVQPKAYIVHFWERVE